MISKNQNNFIALKDCIVGGVYTLNSRNLKLGVFTAQNGFIGIRTKFNYKFLFEELHYSASNSHGTAKPLKLHCFIPPLIPLTTQEIDEATGLDSWIVENGKRIPILRRELSENDAPHGSRKGFEDVYPDTLKRIPDDVWPGSYCNEKLLDYLIVQEDDFITDTKSR